MGGKRFLSSRDYFFSGYLGPLHTTEEEFENGASSIVHANPSRKRRFSETSYKAEEFENAGFAF